MWRPSPGRLRGGAAAAAARGMARRLRSDAQNDVIKFSTSPAAASSPHKSLGAGQENATNSRFLMTIMATGVLLTGSIAYSCLTGTVTDDPLPVPPILQSMNAKHEEKNE